MGLKTDYIKRCRVSAFREIRSATIESFLTNCQALVQNMQYISNRGQQLYIPRISDSNRHLSVTPQFLQMMTQTSEKLEVSAEVVSNMTE